MTKPKPTRLYHYRGLIERSRIRDHKTKRTVVRLARGYSAAGAAGGMLYPWMTRRECITDAVALGFRAIFDDASPPIADQARADGTRCPDCGENVCAPDCKGAV